jgi:hypothetical protein
MSWDQRAELFGKGILFSQASEALFTYSQSHRLTNEDRERIDRARELLRDALAAYLLCKEMLSSHVTPEQLEVYSFFWRVDLDQRFPKQVLAEATTDVIGEYLRFLFTTLGVVLDSDVGICTVAPHELARCREFCARVAQICLGGVSARSC